MVTVRYHRSLIIVLGIILIVGLAGGLSLRRVPQNSAPYPEPTEKPIISPRPLISVPPPEQVVSKWKLYADEKLGITIRYPSTVMLDERQTTRGRLNAFIFAQDSSIPLPGTVPVLFIAGNQGTERDPFLVFQQSDCGTPCPITEADVQQVTMNQVIGIINPRLHDTHSYYLTDTKKSGPVINAYIGKNADTSDTHVIEKIAIFEDMIRTISLER